MTTSPWWRLNFWPLSVTGRHAARIAAVASALTGAPADWPPSLAQRLMLTASAGTFLAKESTRSFCQVDLTSLRRTRSCGRLGPAREGCTVPRSSSRTSVNSGSVTDLVPEEAVGLAVGLDESDGLLIAAGEAQVIERALIDGEEAHRGAVFGGHVGDGGAVGHGQGGDAFAEELDELVDHALLAEDLGDGEDQVGGGGALGQLALEPEADDLGREHVDRLAEHDGLGLDAADAPADDAQAVDHGGVGVGADAANRGTRPSRRRRHCVSTPLARYSRFTWCTMPVAGGTTRKLSRLCWPHLRNS